MPKKDKEANAVEEAGPIDGASELDPFSEEFFEAVHEQLKGRVSKKRLRHIEGVADTADEIAQAYGKDRSKARLAGLLHDWDKGMSDEEIVARAYDLGIEDEIGEWVIENMPEVIHGISASHALKRQFPKIPDDVLHAIKVHTTASTEMSDLDKILYIADAIEPGRDFESLADLRAMIGASDLDDLYFEVYKFWTDALVRRGRALHPDTVRIWNEMCVPRRRAKKRQPRSLSR